MEDQNPHRAADSSRADARQMSDRTRFAADDAPRMWGNPAHATALVVVVDLDDLRRATTCRMLAAEPAVAEIRSARSSAQAGESLRNARLVLLSDGPDRADLPAMMAAVREQNPTVPIVVTADSSEPEVVRRALEQGATSLVISGGDPQSFSDTVAAALRGRAVLDTAIVRPVIGRYAALLDEARRRDSAVIESLAAAVEAKDTVTSRHLQAVRSLATQLASLVEPSLARSEDFSYGCVLHDVGKIGVPERILSKPGPLDADEWTVMRLHPETGVRVIDPLGMSDTVREVVLYHHERWDGQGYPYRLSDEGIPLSARIFSVCDALEAMTATRPYRAPLPAGEAYRRVVAEAGQQFDPGVVEALQEGVGSGEIELFAELAPAR